jgi:hypothetical protein
MKRTGKTISIATVTVGMMVLVWAGITYMKRAKPTASLDGRSITLRPLDATFEIPQSWLDWHVNHDNNRDNLHVTPAELENVRVGEGEWDKEYAEVVNSVLPFKDCVAHLGGEGWGKQSVSFVDVQMRVYLVEASPQKVQEKMSIVGVKAASNFSEQVSVKQSQYGQWHRVILRYSLWYRDYGGEANVDVFTQAIGNRTVVLVFMYSPDPGGQSDDVPAIVKSFTWK